MQSAAQEESYFQINNDSYNPIALGSGSGFSSPTTGYTTNDHTKNNIHEFIIKGSGKNIQVKINNNFVKFPNSKEWDEYVWTYLF
jgi:CRISPR/Cas system CSM-associated protein Csm5 (group 7 of RAMP superfamily)